MLKTAKAVFGSPMREFWIAVSLLWLAGVGLRLTILAVPPVISLIQADLQLSGTEIGVLTGLPIVLFGVAALPGSLLIARFGAVAILVAGLTIAGIASALRGAVPHTFALYTATIVMGAGIAIMQPALPPLVRQWLPSRVSFATALYTNGLLVGETLAVMLTIPVVLPLADNSWRWALAIWGMPLIAIALMTALLAPAGAEAQSSRAQAPTSGWPDWSNPLIWQISFIFGAINSVYFCSNAFLPGYLTGVGRADLIAATLTALNLGQLPASFVLLGVAGKLENRAWPFITCGGLMLACIAGMITTASSWTIVFAAGLGFLGAFVLTLGFALPALLGAQSDVARMSAAMFTISYSEALVISVLSGAAWDVSGSARFAFLPIALSAVPLLFMPLVIKFRRTNRNAVV
jgi:CP family cyanate transporter-like MFS transporter